MVFFISTQRGVDLLILSLSKYCNNARTLLDKTSSITINNLLLMGFHTIFCVSKHKAFLITISHKKCILLRITRGQNESKFGFIKLYQSLLFLPLRVKYFFQGVEFFKIYLTVVRCFPEVSNWHHVDCVTLCNSLFTFTIPYTRWLGPCSVLHISEVESLKIYVHFNAAIPAVSIQ